MVIVCPFLSALTSNEMGKISPSKDVRVASWMDFLKIDASIRDSA